MGSSLTRVPGEDQRHTEEHGEDQDLEHIALGHRLHRIRGKDADQRLRERGRGFRRELQLAGGEIEAGTRVQGNVEHPAAAVAKYTKVALGLGRIEYAEIEGFAGNGQALGIVGGDFEKNAGGGPALVELPRGVEKARAKADGRRHLAGCTYRLAQP